MSLEDRQHLNAIPNHAVHDAVGAQEHFSDVLPVDFRHTSSRLGRGGCLMCALPQAFNPLPCGTWIVFGDVAANGA
jgi:hypothetical protein